MNSNPPSRFSNRILLNNPFDPFIINSSLVCFSDGTLLDGYTRYEILGELGIPITDDMVEIRELPDHKIREDVPSAQ